jgi:carbamoyl-phosphate synthase large subunit
MIQNVLVTSSASKAPLIASVMHAARRLNTAARVVAGDIDPNALTRYVADEFWAMPATRDENLDALIQGCKARCIDTIIPTRDGELEFWAAHSDTFESHRIRVIVSGLEAVRGCLDKLGFFRHCHALGLPVIPTHSVLDGNGPFVVKEQFGAGSKQIGLNLSARQALDHAALLKHPIFQPYVSGIEVSADAWLDQHHRCKGIVVRTRDIVVAGESRQTTTLRHERLERVLCTVLEALHLRGPVVVQAIIDNESNIHVIEVNARFGGASTTGIAAGLDVWHWSLSERAGVDVSTIPVQLCEHPLRLVRIPSDLVIHDHRF